MIQSSFWGRGTASWNGFVGQYVLIVAVTYRNWPAVGELNIMENINGLNQVYGTYHCGVNPGGPCNEPNGLTGNMVPVGLALQGNMHTYTIEIDRTDAELEAIRWYLDDAMYWQVASASVDAETWNESVHNSYFVILSMAMGGNFPNGVYGNTTPIESTATVGTYLIDYVAVYNSA